MEEYLLGGVCVFPHFIVLAAWKIQENWIFVYLHD